jgi:hypothetical protein
LFSSSASIRGFIELYLLEVNLIFMPLGIIFLIGIPSASPKD